MKRDIIIKFVFWLMAVIGIISIISVPICLVSVMAFGWVGSGAAGIAVLCAIWCGLCCGILNETFDHLDLFGWRKNK